MKRSTRAFMREMHGGDFEADILDREPPVRRYTAKPRQKSGYDQLVDYAAPRAWKAAGVGVQIVVGLFGAIVIAVIVIFAVMASAG